MLRELLLRDLAVHRRVLVMAAVTPGLAMAMAMKAGADTGGAMVLSLVFCLVLVCLVPLSLHLRESMLGTLGDLMALPAARRDIVRLRFLEGLIIGSIFVAVSLLLWYVLQHPPLAELLHVLRSPFLLWVLVIFLAYPMPFALRWGGKGVAAAFGVLFGGLFLVGQYLERTRSVPWILEAIGRAYVAGGAASEYGVPLFLLAGFYGLSLWAFDRLDA